MNLRQDFQSFLECGAYSVPPGRAVCAYHHAKTLAEWRQAESAGLVRLRQAPEEDNYFDVYGKPDTEEERKDIERQIERLGCWWVVSEYFDAGRWQHADSIGMCIYEDPTDPFENCYVPDLMRNALDRIPQSGEH